MSTGPDRAAQVDLLCRLVVEHYVFPEVATEVAAALRRGGAGSSGDALDDEQFAAVLTGTLQSVNGDKHLRLMHSVEPVPPDDAGDSDDSWAQAAAVNAGGIRRVERLPGNVGYLDLIAFFPAAVAGWAAVAAMNLLAGTAALIVDLRRSRGGDPAMVALLYSYLVDESMHLNDLYSRSADRTTQFWTLPYLPGPRFGGGKPVWALTSQTTFSAAEEFAYNLQQHRRGTVVGERTRGGAHPCEHFRIAEHLTATIPVARAINPVSGTNWEGTGVLPDIEVPAADALPVALHHALRHVIDLPAPGNGIHTEARQALAELPAGTAVL